MYAPKMILFFVVGFLVNATGLVAQIVTDNQVVAIVNKTVITSYDIFESLKADEVDLKSMSKTEQEYEFNGRLTTLVRRALRDEAAEKSGVAVSPEELENRKIREIEKRGGEEQFETFLRSKGQSMAQFDDEFQRSQEQAAWLRVVSGRGGARLSRELRPLYNITVRPSELRAYYRKNLKKEFTTKSTAKVRVIQVYFRKNVRGDRRAKKKTLLSAKQKLKTKADFAVLAKRYSAHDTKDSGGLIEALEKGAGALVPEIIEEAIFDPKITGGSIIGPIEHVNSYWLIKVEAKAEGRVVPFSEAQAKIRQIRQWAKVNRAIRDVELDLLDKAYIYPASLKKLIRRGLER